MKRIARWIGITIAVLLAAYFIYFATATFRHYDLRPLLTPQLLAATGVAALLYVLIIPLSGWAWRVLLQSMGIYWSTPALAAIMGFTQIAKYLPGNFGQPVGRTALALAKGMPTSGYFVSVLVETFLTMAAGLIVGVACVLLSPTPMVDMLAGYRATLLLFAAGLLLAVLMLPLLFNAISALLRRKQFQDRWGNLDTTTPGLVPVTVTFAAYSTNYLLVGVGLWLITHAIDTPLHVDYLYLTAAFALSWLLGFMTPGAPAGLGVREGAMLVLLSGMGPSNVVVVIITAMRVATVLGDALCFALSAWYLRHTGSEP